MYSMVTNIQYTTVKYTILYCIFESCKEIGFKSSVKREKNGNCEVININL